MKTKFLNFIAIFIALTSVNSFASNESDLMKSFLDNQTHCKSLLEGKAGVKMSNKEVTDVDIKASEDFKKIMEKIKGDKSIFIKSMISICEEKK